MDWLAQNWIWLVLAAGVVWFLARGKHGGLLAGGCCGSHGGSHRHQGGMHGDHAATHEGHGSASTTAAGQGAAEASDKKPEQAHAQHRGGCCG